VLQGDHARETDSSNTLIDVFCVLSLTQGLQKSPKKSSLTDALFQFQNGMFYHTSAANKRLNITFITFFYCRTLAEVPPPPTPAPESSEAYSAAGTPCQSRE
jgi:hypothetical protein